MTARAIHRLLKIVRNIRLGRLASQQFGGSPGDPSISARITPHLQTTCIMASHAVYVRMSHIVPGDLGKAGVTLGRSATCLCSMRIVALCALKANMDCLAQIAAMAQHIRIHVTLFTQRGRIGNRFVFAGHLV